MDEIKFVLKTFVFTIVLILLLQYKMDGVTSLESKAMNWIEYSPISQYLNKVAHGAVLVSKNVANKTSELVHQALGEVDGSGSDSNRASRLNLEFKRNTQSSSK